MLVDIERSTDIQKKHCARQKVWPSVIADALSQRAIAHPRLPRVSAAVAGQRPSAARPLRGGTIAKVLKR
jgi:hypothetical protein